MSDIDKLNSAVRGLAWAREHGFPMKDRSRPSKLPVFDGESCPHRWVDAGDGTRCADCGELSPRPGQGG